MKHALAVVLTLLTASAQAASPEEAYLAARDAAIARLNPPGDPVALSDAAIKEEERARNDVGKLMRAVIGPLNVRGFSGEGAYNVGSLFNGDMETGTLDGLLFSRDKDVRLVVTTTSLADRWIKSPDGLAAKEGAVPQDLRTALTLDEFYTRASSFDAAVSNMGELPVTKPAGADFAFAMLSMRRQDIGPAPVGEMLIGVIAPPRVYIVSAPIAKIRIMAPCEKLFKDADAKADRMYQANEKSKTPREGIVDETEALREKGDEAMRKCFAERMKSTPALVRLTKQAQEIVDGLVAK
jgi:hypothetical protein